ncbi:MAG: SpoIID/LytB domain-containing protein [Paludibacteraceae bacterium]|nr:SpoIID/LytB domain-containing protein [Paludibacteraceae bacterium]
MYQYLLSVGIMSEPTIRFTLHGRYLLTGKLVSGSQFVEAHLGHVRWRGEMYQQLEFVPTDDSCTFTLHDVTIGVGFHWERREDQVFRGGLRLIVEQTTIAGLPVKHDNITAVNIVGIEDYLTSVISSEMSATSSMELLKAHAVTSRSWVLSPIMRKVRNTEKMHGINTGNRRIVWYERDSHNHFDVCADDHCQRYQGITRVSAAEENVRKAIEATWGEVLCDRNGDVCDARFYKCCGGRTELFENAWADTHYHYLESVEDAPSAGERAFCDTQDKRILAQVLNGYDRETADFYTWQVQYSVEELSEIVRDKLGLDFGTIVDIRPLRRGPSGRIYEMELVGSLCSMIIGKELEIRRVLSRSHLYSSAFGVERTATGFVFHGRGWGHGVGLCQIGAAVMAERGYDYRSILFHYFKGATLKTNLGAGETSN